ncbi:MAG: DUF1573 domain-containing protein [Muribaculaceae bacterium]|nr:DUF1573 domain-containing protein [Muribaculaceae bacterium]
MKRIFGFIVLCVMTVAMVVADGGGAVCTFGNRVYDFGVIKEDGGPVKHAFEFTNTGNKPLIIIEATASCGCTRPEFPTKPIQPGKKGKVVVTYSPLGRPGAFSKTVKIKTNGTEPRTTLIIEGTVTPAKSKKK